MATINPCPFCYDPLFPSEPTLYRLPVPEWLDTQEPPFRVVCPRCQTNGPVAHTEAEAIAAWNGAGRWISVEERLPEQGASVLIYSPEFEKYPVNEAWFSDDYAKMDVDPYWFCYGTQAEVELDSVTYWRPLPPPPE